MEESFETEENSRGPSRALDSSHRSAFRLQARPNMAEGPELACAPPPKKEGPPAVGGTPERGVHSPAFPRPAVWLLRASTCEGPLVDQEIVTLWTVLPET